MKSILCIFLLSFIICDAQVGEIEGRYLRLAEILRFPKKIKPHPATLNEFKLNEGVIRIWAFSVTDNKSYMLWLHEDGADNPKLVEFDGLGQKLLKTNRVLLPDWLSPLFDSPIDLRDRNERLRATIEHSFIMECVKNGKYHWAYREIENGNESDYSKLLELLGSASVNPIDIGWAIDK